MKIKTNHNFRPILSWHELTESEQSEYAWLHDMAKESSFFRFKDWAYDLSDFTRVITNNMQRQGTEHELYGWDGYKNETLFSSVLVKYSECGDAVKVGLALS